MSKVYWALGAGLLLISCRQEAPAPQPSESAGEAPQPPAPPETAIIASGARTVVEETDDFLFEYSYPAEAGNIAALAVQLNGRLDRSRAELAAQSANAREAARDDGFPFNKFSSGTSWLVVADTPRFLSLSANMSSYTGGAHGMFGFDSLIWDKQGERTLAPEDFFTNMDALDEALAASFCDLLNRERAVRRGSSVEPGSDDMFDQCVPLSDTTVLLGSSNGRAFNRIGVQVGPYVAGPYAEGSFEFTFPVTAEVIAVVREDYRDAFAARN